MRKNERNRQIRSAYSLSSRQALNEEKKKNTDGAVDREIRAALAVLKEPLDRFAQETEDTLAALEAPPLSSFTTLVHDTMAKVSPREILSFSIIAVSFLTLIGYLIFSGYFLPVALFYSAITLLLPVVILFVPEAQQKEGV